MTKRSSLSSGALLLICSGSVGCTFWNSLMGPRTPVVIVGAATRDALIVARRELLDDSIPMVPTSSDSKRSVWSYQFNPHEIWSAEVVASRIACTRQGEAIPVGSGAWFEVTADAVPYESQPQPADLPATRLRRPSVASMVMIEGRGHTRGALAGKCTLTPEYQQELYGRIAARLPPASLVTTAQLRFE